MDILHTLTEEFHLNARQTENTVKLIDDGNTIPFIARYRKELTGSIDDQVLRRFSDRLFYLRSLSVQAEKVRDSIREQGNLTKDISLALDRANTLTEVEDIYRPFRPKRRTRAAAAREKGLLPLAELLYAQQADLAPEEAAAVYCSDTVPSVSDALSGARDILAERISDDPVVRKRLRHVCMQNGRITSCAAAKALDVYEMYGNFSEPLARIAGHRILALNRGEREGFLKVSIAFDKAYALHILTSLHIKNQSKSAALVADAIADAYTRLLFPALEREIRSELTERANTAAIQVFADNTRHLLMQPPVKNKVVLGFDPGYRTGCKMAVVDGTGKLLDTGVIYPAPPHNKIQEAKQRVKQFLSAYGVEVIAIGNGTASHETEVFVADLLRELNGSLSYMVVSEAGASVYSASSLAAQEFPNYDVSLRSAISIARRLQDPLAELVKIDPKAIGVGQYQHDMPQNRLSETLDGVVEDCVNRVGVDLNTASAPLLSRISGIGPALANNITAYRAEHGIFTSRTQLKQVTKLGPKAFQQCAGFLRVAESREPLDNTGVHPESYPAAKKLLALCGYSAEKATEPMPELQSRAQSIGLQAIAQQLGIGVPTLLDILTELQKPGRDPRDELPQPMLRSDVMELKDLKPGMELLGTVRNVIDFGAFVDVGVHQDGLVHISQIADHYIRHPSEVLRVGDIVTVWVLSADPERKRISLTMKPPAACL